MTPPAGTWHPTAETVAGAQVTALARAAGVADYDALLALSLADPAAYWAHAHRFLGIRWSVTPTSYVDLGRGPEFPRWFPGGELNWVDSVLQHAEHAPGRLAVVAERENGETTRLTYAELDTRVRAFAGLLRQRGVHRGERIGLLCENGAEATVALLAIAHLGAIAVPLFSGFGADAVVSRLSAAGARGLVATDGFDRRGRRIDLTATVREAVARVPGLDIVVPASEVLTASADPVRSVPVTADDPFLVIHTSGTTGKPKGAVHAHGGFPLKIAHDAAVHFDIGPGDVLCWPADMGWIAGSLVLASAMLRGATLVCYDGAPDFPDWSRLAALVERHGITHLGSAPTLIRGLAAHQHEATAADLSSIRLLITAGEGIDPDHFTWFQQHFGDGRAPLVNYTGGTEVSGALLASVIVRPIAPAAFNSTSPGVDVRVVDATGNPVVDEPGELAIGGPFVGMTQSFWEDDERYLDSYWRTIPGLWIHGDLAQHRSGTDDHVMLGRSDDTIKIAGKRLGPAEVEEGVAGLPGVVEAAAIGVPDDLKGEHVVVFVVPAPEVPGRAIDPLALVDDVGARIEAALGKAFRPRAVHVVAALPKTRSGKVMRRAIRGAYRDQEADDLSALDDSAPLDAIRQLGRQVRGE